MSIRKSIMLLSFLLLHTFCNCQSISVNFPDSFKTSSKYYSPVNKPISKSAMWGVISIGQPYDSLILWPSIPLYYPNESLLSKLRDSIHSNFIIIVDTVQNLDCYEYFFWIKNDKKYYPERRVGYIEKDRYTTMDAKNTNQAIFKGYSVYLINLSDTAVTIRHRKYNVPIVQEAIDSTGSWKPIETLFSPLQISVPANYYGVTPLKPGEILVSSIYNYKGDFQTLLRVKITINGTTYHSKSFQGSINYSQITSIKTYKFH
ncbi:hypothetical protein ESA94_19810 [Lacibacter luteus]|uniref:Uncharacterized protein n=1 Tax=Lacibacter luteus TaxID=2508719 RepID=A0A4Q1CDZ1_9BACT|nr:hypothetical protein [Lacibacter luteus]RXK57768.1 hypothetical protein ESA94_19810 [Lacibacter luteus]